MRPKNNRPQETKSPFKRLRLDVRLSQEQLARELNLPSLKAKDSHIDSTLDHARTRAIVPDTKALAACTPLLGCFLNESLMGETPKTALVRLITGAPTAIS